MPGKFSWRCSGAGWKPAVHSLKDDSFDGAFVSGLLDGVFQLRRDRRNLHFGHCVAHLKDFRASVNAKSAGSAIIFNSNFHVGLQKRLVASTVTHNRLLYLFCGSKGKCFLFEVEKTPLRTYNQSLARGGFLINLSWSGPMQASGVNLVRRGTEQP